MHTTRTSWRPTRPAILQSETQSRIFSPLTSLDCRLKSNKNIFLHSNRTTDTQRITQQPSSHMYVLYIALLRAELSKNVQQDYYAHKGKTGDEHSRRSHLQSRRVVRVELQNVVARTGGTAASSCGLSGCCASLCCLKIPWQRVSCEI